MKKIDKNYHQALTQIADKITEIVHALGTANERMIAGRPELALDCLEDAKKAIDGAIVSVRWAKTLPEPEDQ